MAWRNCAASLALVKEINERWPNRDKASDGTIGDAEHATRTSDHNPHVVVAGVGVVRARDIDKDGIDALWLAEHLRKLGAAGDHRLTGGGYVIFNRRITLPDFSGWKDYQGVNSHASHIHVSFSRNQAGFDSTAGWGIVGVTPAPSDGTYCKQGDRGDRVKKLQQFMTKTFPSYNPYRPTGFYGVATTDGVREFQRRVGITGPDANGKTVGPRTLAKLREHGFQP
jgi:hypothetical protein